MLRLRQLLENNKLEYLSSFVQFELRSLMSCHMTFFSCLPSLSGPSTHTYSTQYVLGHKISFFLIFKKEMLKTINSFRWILFMIIIFFNSCFFWFEFLAHPWLWCLDKLPHSIFRVNMNWNVKQKHQNLSGNWWNLCNSSQLWCTVQYKLIEW